MRIWNGLVANNVVEYNNKRYLVTRLYKKGEEKLADLHSPSEDIEGVSIFECKKLES
ncbi:MAG: hypothetical protein ACI4UE_01355 [Candidatus Scatovivens sp.]